MVTTQTVPDGREMELEVWTERFLSRGDRALAGHANRLSAKTLRGKCMSGTIKVLRHGRVLQAEIF